ncbi:phosphatase PAP2 family protein [Halalkalibacter alkalisediminis]|uniref:Phosphatase PAP2 family protein n=1 Tax=Halalkalibacter alkalisediminis TaxID=935616 RepID=A0ABV6NGY4_9BACI|nr:phosphatase PAP2 family protein [Halalkalibacter alkalisediminis]
MKHKLWWMFILFFILPLAGFITTTYFVTNGEVLPLDKALLNLVKPIESAFLTKFMSFFSHLGSTGPVVVLSFIFLAIIYVLYRKKDEVLLFVIVSLGSTGINQNLKFVFKRERPFEQIVVENGFSYPSGHTMAAVSLYGIVTFLFWRHISTVWGRILLIILSSIMISVIGFSRIYLRVHYPSDIVAAFLVSGMWLFVSISIYQYVMEKRYEKRRI